MLLLCFRVYFNQRSQKWNVCCLILTSNPLRLKKSSLFPPKKDEFIFSCRFCCAFCDHGCKSWRQAGTNQSIHHLDGISLKKSRSVTSCSAWSDCGFGEAASGRLRWTHALSLHGGLNPGLQVHQHHILPHREQSQSRGAETPQPNGSETQELLPWRAALPVDYFPPEP